MNRKRLLPVGIVVIALLSTSASAELAVRQIPGQAEAGTVEIHGVEAGDFAPGMWQAGQLHFVADVRSPMLSPRLDGVFRNIYAPSIVEVPGGWEVYYGAWDGVPTGNDRIYRVTTRDFLNFENWRIVVEHGPFQHVCNVSAARDSERSVHMLCTAYPVGPGLNKPAAFRVDSGSLAGDTARAGRESPIQPSKENLVTIEGYEPFAAADMNGVNVLLIEDGQYRLYFCDFKNWGKVYRASSKDGKDFRLDGPCVDAAMMVNDVKKFTPGEESPCYLMGLHRNTDRLWYALSTDGMKFDAPRELGVHLGPADRYMVAIGWVTQGDRLLGFLYGAGASPELNRNRIFARWLQKKIVFTGTNGNVATSNAALGPDRCTISLAGQTELTGQIQIFAEDGRTALSKPMPVKLMSGGVYQVENATKP